MTTNPLVALAYALGVVIGLPALTLVVRGTAFITQAMGKLDAVQEKQDDLATAQRALSDEFREFREDKHGESQAVELSLTIIENDVNALQSKTGMPVRTFPDRRVGPPDRRQRP